MKKLIISISLASMLLVIPQVVSADKPSWAGKPVWVGKGKPSSQEMDQYKENKKLEKEDRKYKRELEREEKKRLKKLEKEKAKEEREYKKEEKKRIKELRKNNKYK